MLCSYKYISCILSFGNRFILYIIKVISISCYLTYSNLTSLYLLSRTAIDNAIVGIFQRIQRLINAGDAIFDLLGFSLECRAIYLSLRSIFLCIVKSLAPYCPKDIFSPSTIASYFVFAFNYLLLTTFILYI